MPTVISFVSTKGGVGKTTLAANLAGILADYGMRVLAIDGDIQPSLSKYYPLHEQASYGLNAVITRGGSVHADSISRTTIANLDLIYSDAPDGSLQNWLRDREDRLMIMRRAMAGPLVQPYNVVVIDTQGAVGELQKTAAMAADYMISPIKPDTLSAGEFSSGTLGMLDDLNRLADFGEKFRSGDLYALINAQERNNNARVLTTVIRQKFAGHRKVRVLDTVVPSAAAYAAAATAQRPVHRYDRRPTFANSAWHVMHQLVWELFPSLKDIYVDDVIADDDDRAACSPAEEGLA